MSASPQNISHWLTLARQPFTTPEGTPHDCSAATPEAGCVVFLAWSQSGERARVISARGQDLDRAWALGVDMLLARLPPTVQALDGLRVDIVDHVTATTWGDLKARMSQPARLALAQGVAFDAAFERALLAQEIDGHAIFDRTEPRPDHLRAYSQERFAAALEFPGDDAAPMWCFTTRAVYIDANGARPVGTTEPGIDEVGGFVDATGRHLAAQVDATGRFAYGWSACFDRPVPSYSTWHHASAIHALLEAWELRRDDTLKAAIDRALSFMTRRLMRPAVLPDGTRVVFLLDLGDEIKLGGNGACLRVLVKYTELTGDAQYTPLMAQLAQGILHMQVPESGQFVHVRQAPKLEVTASFQAIDHDGEAALGLVLLHRLTGEPRWLAAVEKAFEHFIAHRYWRAHDHRLSHCVNELTRHRPSPQYFQFGLHNVAGHNGFAPERAAALLEQAAAAYDMVSRMDADAALRSLLAGGERDKLRQALAHHAQALDDSRFRPESAMFFGNPTRLRGAFFSRSNGFRVRIDDTARALSGCMAWLEFLQSSAGPVVAWGGNVNLGRRQNHRTQALGAAAVLGGVPVIARADLGIVNLECVVSDRGQRTEAPGGELPHHCRARPEMLRILSDAGIDLAATANDHSSDYGDEARAHQAQLLDAAGIGHAGSGPTRDAAWQPALRRAGELNVALFAIDATCARFAAGEDTPGNAYLPPDTPAAWAACMAPRIAAARAQAHVVIVAVHWGAEGAMQTTSEKVAIGHALIDAGADAVLGASAHVLQGVEIYRHRPIVHDAGDLLFDARRREDDTGGVFSLHLSRHGVQRVVFTPIRVGYGQTVQREGLQATSASWRFLRQCEALGAEFRMAPSGHQCLIDLQPPVRPSTIALPALPPVHLRPHAICATPEPLDAWLVDTVPRTAKLASPPVLGPLRLLGAQVTPDEITGRCMLRVETFWTLAADTATATDWRLDLCVVPAARNFMPPWGAGMDHDPCDWMWPTSRWQPGRIYRDVHDLRPPVAAAALYDAELQLEVGLVDPAGVRVAPVRVPRFVGFTARPDQATPPPMVPLPPAPVYRTAWPDALPPDLPDAPDHAWNAAQLVAVTGGTWLVEPPPGWYVRSVPRGELLMDMLPAPALFAASDYWTLALHEGFANFQNERNWDWSDEIARLQPNLAGVMLDKPIAGLAPDFPVLQVADPMQALIELGIVARERLRGHVVAATGSAGKTSTCQMLAHAFSPSYKLVSTIENYNSRLGMLAMLANVPAQTDLVVLEVAVSAINAPGFQNIKRVRPDLAVITNIAASHLGEGETIESVARRKANIFEGMQPGAWAVICTDTEYFDHLLMRARAKSLRVLTYGTAASADFRLETYDAASGRVRARHGNAPLDHALGAKGLHMAVNSLVCFAVAHALALDSAPLPARLASFAAVAGRGQSLGFSLGDRRFRVVDESYNANPLSMAAALATLADEPCEHGRKLLVLGDMLELGDDTQRYHEALVVPVAQCAPAQVFLLGASMTALHGRIAAALPATSAVHSFDALAALEAALIDAVRSGDIVLLKSSNGMRLWQIVRTLTQRQKQEEAVQQQARHRVPPMPLPPAAVIRRAGTPAAAMPATPSWILYDMTADRLLTHQPAAHPFVPASFSKLVTAFLVERKRQAEGLDRDGEPQAMADEAALELASWHSGDVDTFVTAMNRQAQAWGMHDTHFACPAGLRTPERTTVVDMLVMARHVLQDFPSMLAQAAPSDHPLRHSVPGVDGLKASDRPDCGSHLIATARRDERRLISVVLGAQDSRTCAQLSALLLQRGFETPQVHAG